MSVDNLHTKIKKDVMRWRKNDYASESYAISEILQYQFIDDERMTLRYLRRPQFEAIETYFYLRYIKRTEHIIDLYKGYYPNHKDLLYALNVCLDEEALLDALVDGGISSLFERIRTDDTFIKKYALENVRESMNLLYPSYIFSLIMGAGKTILIGAIIFIEFALSIKTGKDCFLKNALIFAPGKTILGSLKEISCIESHKILPPAWANILESNLKITYTKDNERDIPIIKESNYNIIVTNIEKIRIQSTNIKNLLTQSRECKIKENDKKDIVNLRLQTLSTLSSLGIFSDEAHHTYGIDIHNKIKKVRQTIDYLASKTHLKVVVNTTGTPYFKRHILKDVVFWYGLLEGIEGNILKDIREGNIFSYSEVRDETFIKAVIKDFFTTYKDIKIEGGYMPKIAIYFPKIVDAQEMKPIIEQYIAQEYGLSPNVILEVNSESSNTEKDLFNNRINNKDLPYRIFLLVNMGTEGWNCPSLFSCCLARNLGNSKNFVLQAATRCLRQIPNNTTPARIYLSEENAKILDKQLQENFRDDLQRIQTYKNTCVEKKITLIKYDDRLPHLKVKKTLKRYIKKEVNIKNIHIERPEVEVNNFKRITYDLSKIKRGDLTETEITTMKEQNRKNISLFEASHKISMLYSVDYFTIFSKLKEYFSSGYMHSNEFIHIKKQIEKQVHNYEVKTEEVEECLAIIKKEGFQEEINEEGIRIYTTKILVNKEKLNQLLKEKNSYKANSFSFHYEPYKFDSRLEVNFFEYFLEQINEKKENIKDFFFIGGLTDRNKTDLIFEYRDSDGKIRNYTPDFLLIKKNGKYTFIEIKGKYLEKNFKIKENYLKPYLIDNFEYELMLSDDHNITMEDKERIQKHL